MNIKIKMIKLNSNSVAVDEIKDVKKAENLLIQRHRMKKIKNRIYILMKEKVFRSKFKK